MRSIPWIRATNHHRHSPGAASNAKGNVEYTATFTMLKPIDMSKASGVLGNARRNRGGRAIVCRLGVTAANPAGDGFDQKPGHVDLAAAGRANSGVNPALPAETIDLPVVQGVTGRPSPPSWTIPATSIRSRSPIRHSNRDTPDSLDTSQAKLESMTTRPSTASHGRDGDPEQRLGLGQLRRHTLPGYTRPDADLSQERL